MQPHQERVVAEKTDLDGKIERLTTFIHGKIYSNLDGLEQDRLNRQLRYMNDYSNVLGERIAAFTVPA